MKQAAIAAPSRSGLFSTAHDAIFLPTSSVRYRSGVTGKDQLPLPEQQSRTPDRVCRDAPESPNRHFGHGRRDDPRVEKKRERQKATLRQVVRSRTDAGKSASTPTSWRECVLRNFLYASRKCRRFPRSRSNSRYETSTATGSPRRVSSIPMPASAWSTILGRRDRASAMEYLRGIQ